MVDAKKYLVSDIKLPSFIIEILDDEQKPVAGVGFSVYVDGVGMSIVTDNEGIIRVPMPRNEIRLSLEGEETSAISEEKTSEEAGTSAPPMMPIEPVSTTESPPLESEATAESEFKTLLKEIPSKNEEYAEWILKAHEKGFVKFKFDCKECLENLKNGEKVKDVNPESAIILPVMYTIVKEPVARWQKAGETGEKPTITLGSFIRPLTYLFSWDKIPGDDDGKVRDVLKQYKWVKNADIEKTDDGTTIKVSKGKNSLSLRLNNEKTKVTLTIDGSKKNEFIVKIANDVKGIYRADSHSLGQAIDINDLDFQGTSDRVIQVLEDLPPGSYGIGLPFQGEFFPLENEIEHQKQKEKEKSIKITNCLQKFTTWLYAAEWDETNKNWKVSTDKDSMNKAYSLMKSEILKNKINKINTEKKVSLIIFPDNDNHMHLDKRG